MTGGVTDWDELAWPCFGLSVCTWYTWCLGLFCLKLIDRASVVQNICIFIWCYFCSVHGSTLVLLLCVQALWQPRTLEVREKRREEWLFAVHVLYENALLGSGTPEWEKQFKHWKIPFTSIWCITLMRFKGVFPYLSKVLQKFKAKVQLPKPYF